ncbi:hypothetical protein SRABI133_01849 [Peribacillus simplex]|uniref:Uncharacterized protein n=1 Tax=Peribacillus simplex TaxID=1478 RepID=A0A9W4KZR0_9BACI|nr:hypothetical protein SRABI133_01849 [Peribacillus simplex]
MKVKKIREQSNTVPQRPKTVQRTPIFMVFYCNPHWIEEICDTPAELLASRDTTGACFDAAWQTVGEKGADFRNQLNFSNKKLQANLSFHRVCLQSEITKMDSVVFLNLIFYDA